jgi:hypothetical protein
MVSTNGCLQDGCNSDHILLEECKLILQMGKKIDFMTFQLSIPIFDYLKSRCVDAEVLRFEFRTT